MPNKQQVAKEAAQVVNLLVSSRAKNVLLHPYAQHLSMGKDFLSNAAKCLQPPQDTELAAKISLVNNHKLAAAEVLDQ